MNRSLAPTFSVIVPAYNAAETVGEAIRSVLNQTIDDFELIVVDDGSTDSTSAEIALFAADPRVCHMRQANVGLAATRNRALEQARGRYASFLDADDLLLPQYLEVMGDTLEGAPSAAFAHCDFWIFDEATGEVSAWPLGRLQLPADSNELLRVMLRRNVLHYAVTARMDVLRAVGCFNADLRACEDVELWMRILARGFSAVRAPGRLCIWRNKGGSLSTQAVLMTRSLSEVYRLVAEEYDVDDEIRDLARSRRRAELRQLASLTGERRVAAALARARRTVTKLRLPRLNRARPDLPPDVAAAFPELGRVRGAPPPASQSRRVP
jgi:glycosyltransferase involved in cell wall biosynthesis